jgi:hypothetical protein
MIIKGGRLWMSVSESRTSCQSLPLQVIAGRSRDTGVDAEAGHRGTATARWQSGTLGIRLIPHSRNATSGARSGSYAP